MRKRKNIILCVFCLCIIVSLTAGSGFAGRNEKPAFSVNENGQTYGSDMKIEDPQAAPDLISILASNGKEGYAYKEDLYALEYYLTEEKALENSKIQTEIFKKAAKKNPDVMIVPWHSIPVYESDGKTIIGEYVYMYSPYLVFTLREDGRWYDGLGNLVTDLDKKGNPVPPDIKQPL